MVEYRYYHIDEDYPVLILQGEKWTQNYGNDVDGLHFHNHLEIGYCYDGHGRMVFGDQILRYHGGMFSFISKNYHHTTLSDLDSQCTWGFIFIDTESILKRAYGDNHYLIDKVRRKIDRKAYLLSDEEKPVIGGYIRTILSTNEERGEMFQQELEYLCLGLLIQFARLDNEEDTLKVLAKENILAPALEYINHYYSESIKMEYLARLCHMSETHLRRCFQSIVHMSPVEYLNKIRIYAACEKLRMSNTSVNVIAEECGFTTNSTFNRNFMRIVGCAPVEWRKKQNEYEHIIKENEIKTEQGW